MLKILSNIVSGSGKSDGYISGINYEQSSTVFLIILIVLIAIVIFGSFIVSFYIVKLKNRITELEEIVKNSNETNHQESA